MASFCFYFRFFQLQFYGKIVDLSGIWTGIVTMTVQWFRTPKPCRSFPFFKNLFFKASFMFCFSALSAMSQRSLKLSWKCLTWVKSNFLKMGQPRPLLSFIFGLFELKLQFKQQICVKKYPSSLRCQDSNPQPSDHESPPITTRPGLPPSSNFLCKRFLKGGRLSPRNDKN